MLRSRCCVVGSQPGKQRRSKSESAHWDIVSAIVWWSCYSSNAYTLSRCSPSLWMSRCPFQSFNNMPTMVELCVAGGPTCGIINEIILLGLRLTKVHLFAPRPQTCTFSLLPHLVVIPLDQGLLASLALEENVGFVDNVDLLSTFWLRASMST